jgi:hypothetical protein
VGAFVPLTEPTTNCISFAPRAFGVHVERIPVERAQTIIVLATGVGAHAVVKLVVRKQRTLLVAETEVRLLVAHAFTWRMREVTSPLTTNKVSIGRSKTLQVHLAWSQARHLPATSIGSKPNGVRVVGEYRAVPVADPKEQLLMFAAVPAWSCDVMD